MTTKMKGGDNYFVQNENHEKLKLSVVVISLNEESNIERLLKSVGWAEEVVVYDSGSTDRTVEIAKKMGAKVIQGPWLGFGPTKRKAVELASHDWIISFDCDEEVSTGLRSEILRLYPSLNPKVVYKVPRLSFYLGKPIMHGGWYPDYQNRIFNRNVHNWNLSDIHEKVESENYELLNGEIIHFVFKNMDHHIHTNNKYSTLQANELFQKGQKASWYKILIKPGWKFFECYFLKLGILDGWPGFIIARNAAYSVFWKWTKLSQMWKQLERGGQ